MTAAQPTAQQSFQGVVDLAKVKPDFCVPFNHRWIDGDLMIVNPVGDFLFLTPAEFKRFIEADTVPGDGLYERLADKNFIASLVNPSALSERFAKRKSFLRHGPTLHAFVLTERCNHGCQYCHSSVLGMKRFDTDMSIEVAEKGVDVAFQTTSSWLNIEFQGGEPTANWETLAHIVKYAQEKNKYAKKALSFSLVTNFSLMTDERLAWLLENRVQICTSLDGPEDLHNRIRIFKDGNSHQLTTGWIAKVNAAYAAAGLDTNLYRVEALPTITKASLTRARDIVDEFVKNNCRAIFLRKLDPFGFAAQSHKKLGYTMEEFLAFYAEALDYIIELNKQGVQVMERYAAIMLCKMLDDFDPNYLDLRSPGGAVLGQMAYHPNGDIYTSDEGRMVAAMGEDMFRLGNVRTHGYFDIVTHPTTKAMALASTNLAQPGCVSCTYQTFCGQQPEYNFTTQGSIWGRMQDSTWCKKHKYIFDTLARRLKRADPEEMEIFKRWTINRSQDHFLQDAD